MKKPYSLLIIASIAILASCSSQTNKKAGANDFDPTQYKYNNQMELAKAFMASLASNDTASIMQQYEITDEVISYAETVCDFYPQDSLPLGKKIEKVRKQLDEQIRNVWGPTLRNLVKKIAAANIDLSTSTITVDTIPSKSFHGSKSLLTGEVLYHILTKDQKDHKLSMYELIRVKNKWFILTPVWDLDGEAVHNR